ncbi:disease resistance RPP13-like protein 4 [Cinnamomum micranthum f. kanehirae]|uniref:Disease resistance RPP13-like protein 4 n=1 Tax=Cinnamomum micranthum f. kanehirae TaxID=337451 RepID=A0A3S3MQY7_9MAGN|nr:disease resistance RPP13-like protein 4 [Cinnamomum micranthum f. kanehirae]
MSMATNGSGTPPNVEEKIREKIIEKIGNQMAAVRRELDEIFKRYEKKAKAQLGKLTREAHQAYEDRETDQSEGTTADIQKTMVAKVKEMEQLKEKVESCLKDVLGETGESKDRTPKVDKTSEERKQLDEELEKMLEDAAAKGDKGEDFDKLPENFRKCLLCLSIFPVGSEISKRVLIYWWIGEGFVSPIQQKSAEQVGEDYFKLLLDSEFIHPVYNKRSGSIVKCRIHPWIHWMLISKAKESNFFNFDETGTPTSSPSEGHRACLITKLDDAKPELWPEPKPSPDAKELKSLFNINVKYLNLDMEHFSRMKKIVVLQLGRWHASAEHHIEMDPQLLEKLSSLINLKYLSLRGISVIETIPKSIGKLQHLQVLDLRGCQNLKNLTDGITKLRRLTHLDVSECYMLESMPKGLSSLSELLVLKGFVISRSKKAGRLADLIDLAKLKKLSIIIGSQVKKNTDQFGELEKMKSISSFTVIWSDLPENTPGYKEHQVDSLKFPPELEKLDLRFYPIKRLPKWLDPKYPPQLEKLKKLYIRGGKLETLVSEDGIHHPTLDIKVLRLKFLQKLKLKWSDIELPSLDYLEHSACKKMEDPLPLMDVDGVWTRVKETDLDVPPSTTTVAAGATSTTTTTTTTTTDATTSQTHHDTPTTAPIATSTPTTTTSTSTDDSTIAAASAIIPEDVAAAAATATSPSGPSSSPTLATTTTTATSPLTAPNTGPALAPPPCPTTTTDVSPTTPKVAPGTPDLDDDNEHDEPEHDPSSSEPEHETVATGATTSQSHHDNATTAPITTSTPTATTSISTTDNTISAPLAIIPDDVAAAATATSPSPSGPSSSPTVATTTTTATSPPAAPNTGPALAPPSCPTTTTDVSPPTPKVVPSAPDLDDDNEHNEQPHDPSSSASIEAHLIDPHTTSLDGISASGVDSLVDEPTSGTPHVPSHILPAPTTALGPSSSTPIIVPPNKVDHEDKSEHDISSSASTVAHAIDPNTASSDDVTVSAVGAASTVAEPTSGAPFVPSHSVPGPTNAADVTRDSSLSSNPSSSTATSNQPSISTPPHTSSSS